MILIIDNYDSFTYNIVQYLGELGAELLVHRNDELNIKDIKKIEPKKIIILEGLHIFCNSELISLIDFGLFLDLDSHSRLSRRIKRDIKERGRTEVEVINRFNDMCEPMYQKFIYPSRTNANVIINNAQKSINDIINLIDEFI